MEPKKSAPQPDTPLPIPKKSLTKDLSSHSMWDAFEHVLLFISLYVCAISYALLLHYFVDKWIPRFPENSYTRSVSYMNTALRGYLSAIIVSYPLFLFLFLRITAKTIKDPTLRKIKSRKVLIYITLVITFIISLSNFISIVYNLLGGNITTNFIAHFIVTFLISGIIFMYYLWQVKEDRIYA